MQRSAADERLAEEARAHDRPRGGWPSGRGAFFAVALLVEGVHLALFAYFAPLEVIFADRPLAGGDFATHIAQATRVAEGLDGWGRTWVYNVQLLAGHPSGTIFDADNKAWSLWTWAGTQLGLSQGLAFNLFVVAAHLSLPVVVFSSARLFGLGRWTALVATAMGMSLWFFDSFAHWCWWAGMVAYAFAGYLFLLPLALFHRYLHTRRLAWAWATALVLGLAHLVHPYHFVILVVPMLAMAFRARRSLGAKGVVTVVAIAAVVLAINAYWLAVAFDFWHYILDSAYFGQAGSHYFAADALGWLLSGETSGFIATRASFRLLYTLAAGMMLIVWWRRRDPRALVFALGIGTMLAIAYVLAPLQPFAQLQPYRFTMAGAFWAVIPAAAAVEWIVRRIRVERRAARIRRRRPGIWGWLLILLALPAAQHLVAEVVYFFPEEQPVVATLSTGGKPLISASGYQPHPTYRHHGPAEANEQLTEWIREHDRGTGRWLVENPALGDELTWSTKAQILGGFIHRNLDTSWANFFRHRPQGIGKTDELRRYFRLYAVEYAIISARSPWWDTHPDLLEKVATFGANRVYRVRRPTALVARGGGRARASTNRIEVEGSNPNKDLVLRFHYMGKLACRPDCAIERHPIDYDPVGFIRIPAPHPVDLEIVNTYGSQRP